MSKWIAELLALAISFSAQNALHGGEVISPGKTIVMETKERYQSGEYSTFLSQLHEQYQNAGQAGALRGLFESAKNAMKDRPSKAKIVEKEQNHERNQRLLKAAEENPDLEIVKRIDSVAFFNPTKEHQKLLNELEELKFHIPETAEATLENKISALETEYYIKSLLLDVASHHGKTGSDLTEKKVALQLEKFDKMEAAADEAGDFSRKKNLAKTRDAFLAESTYRADLSALDALATGTLAAENPVEEKVKEIMMEYHTQSSSEVASK